MYASVQQQLPQFIKDYSVYYDFFTDINKLKTCWVLTRNLKFLEFFKKQLVAAIDLQTTCLRKIKSNIDSYEGAESRWYHTSIHPIETENQISLGKYAFHAMNIYKIYVIIQCWDKCVVLKRLPDFKGFEIKAEYENLLSYRIIHGTINYCAVVELKFKSNAILKTDFEDELDASGKKDLANQIEMHHLLERIRCAKAELQLHKSITAQSFYSIQNNLTLGEPFLRTYKIEEKQILGRCGDIWKRFTANDDLVIGVPLVNQCTPPNLSIIHNLMPVLNIKQSTESCIELHYRLYQLKIKFDQLDDLETLQDKIWCANGDMQLLPESFAVLLIKLKISQIISAKEGSLILNYEVIRHLHVTKAESINTTFTMPLQLYLQNLDFDKILYEERALSEIKFSPRTLHQDFLSIAMTAAEINLKIIFQNCEALEIFENYLQKNFEFSKPMSEQNLHSNVNKFKTVFYSKNSSSLWFSTLILRMKELTDDIQCVTTWKIYCKNFEKALFLVKSFLNEHLAPHCNIIFMTNSVQESSYLLTEFGNALRQELAHVQRIDQAFASKNYCQENLKSMEELYLLQMNSDIKANAVIENSRNQ